VAQEDLPPHLNEKDEEAEDLKAVNGPGEALPSTGDPSLEVLRDILFSQYRQQIIELEAELAELERRITDPDRLITIITPVLSDAIRRRIRDARDEMVDAFYPIIGQIVVRAVSEAIRDLARTIDAQMRTSFNLPALGQRWWAKLHGIPTAEMALRQSLPFQVAELFLIHRETGLLLWHISSDPTASLRSEIISGMLTAIGDFVKESFGHGEAGQLDEIQYGERRILLEAARYAYLAIVIDGIEPPGFRAEIRERIIAVDHTYAEILRNYDGDPTPLAPAKASLRSLITGTITGA